MNKQNQNKQTNLLSIIFGCVLFGLPAKPTLNSAKAFPPKIEPEHLAQTNPNLSSIH